MINVDKNIKIVPETTKTKNDSNILDKNLKNASGELITPSNQSNLNFTYQALGDYTISLASNFRSTASNTAGFSIKNGGKLTLGDSQYDELDISISQGGYLAFDGNSGHDIYGPLIMVNDGGSLEANAGITFTNNKIAGSVSAHGRTQAHRLPSRPRSRPRAGNLRRWRRRLSR